MAQMVSTKGADPASGAPMNVPLLFDFSIRAAVFLVYHFSFSEVQRSYMGISEEISNYPFLKPRLAYCLAHSQSDYSPFPYSVPRPRLASVQDPSSHVSNKSELPFHCLAQRLVAHA